MEEKIQIKPTSIQIMIIKSPQIILAGFCLMVFNLKEKKEPR